MRRSSGTITPCITGYLGETEDYNVTLLTSGNRAVSNTESKSLVLAMAKEETGSLSVSPNPSNGMFTITLPKNTESATYEVVNMNGVSVLRNRITNTGVFKINISNQPAGLYILRILNKEGKQQTQKLQKL